jgi:hypothetical protein
VNKGGVKLIKASALVLSIFLIFTVSGCIEKTSSSGAVEEVPLSSVKEQLPKEDVSVQVIPHSDGSYECDIVSTEKLEITVVPRGQNFVILIKNNGDSGKFVKEIEAQVDQNRERTVREVNREILPDEELSVTFKDRGQGQVLPKIYLVEVVL